MSVKLRIPRIGSCKRGDEEKLRIGKIVDDMLKNKYKWSAITERFIASKETLKKYRKLFKEKQ